MSQVQMADSVEPERIPARFRQRPNGVLAYFDGEYAWPDAVLETWPRWVRIATRPVRLNPDASAVRELDVERGDAAPFDWPPFYEARKRIHGPGAQAICYCDRSTVPAVHAALLAHGGPAAVAGTLWHIATLDGYAWQPAQLSAELARQYRVEIDPAAIWAIQWLPMGSYDVSTVYGQPRWGTPAYLGA